MARRLLAPLDAPTRQERVYERLRDAIASGELHHQDRISLRELAEGLQVSTTPIREALRRLEAEGLVAVDRGAGVRIQRLSPEIVKEEIQIRVRLETMVMEDALERLDPATVTRAEQILDRADLTEDPEEWSALNIAFHGTLYDATIYRRALKIVKTLWVSPEPYLRLYMRDPENLRVSQREHRVLLEAVKRRDREAALEAVETHIRRSEVTVLEAVAREAAEYETAAS